MNREQLIRRLRKLARKTGTMLEVETNAGKGSHYRVKYGAKVSTLQHDLNPGRIQRFLRQLGIDPETLWSKTVWRSRVSPYLLKGRRTMNWIYGVTITREDEDFVVSVRDLPEVVTSGSDEAEALALAADAIAISVAGRIKDEVELLAPSASEVGEHALALGAQLAAKASIYALWRKAGISKSELARRLCLNEGEVRRLLNPEHATKLDRIDEAARALGGRILVGTQPIAA